ncbi:hypothetical protein LJR084_006699 [Variovorax sp. LjRoot84]|uniref:hypothetical protein n=1 Tax=Variovorax sp. LjRoot84 TaxID=3342340 RepID=UPI003ED103E8
MRYWCAWYAARYAQALRMPVPVPVAIQFIVDHAARKADAASKADLVSELPPDIDQALVANGYKARLGGANDRWARAGAATRPAPRSPARGSACGAVDRLDATTADQRFTQGIAS